MIISVFLCLTMAINKWLLTTNDICIAYEFMDDGRRTYLLLLWSTLWREGWSISHPCSNCGMRGKSHNGALITCETFQSRLYVQLVPCWIYYSARNFWNRFAVNCGLLSLIRVDSIPDLSLPRMECRRCAFVWGIGERTYVSRYPCSPVPMFPGTYVPWTYVPRYLCSPICG